jgi:hypothetical protein
MAFVQTVERVIDMAERSPEHLVEQGRRAAAFISDNYSLAREESDVIRFWTDTVAAG